MKPVHIPKQVQKTFLDVAKANTNSSGRHIETLAFLYGHETEDALIANGILFPVQQGDAGNVIDKGRAWSVGIYFIKELYVKMVTYWVQQ